MSTFSSALVHRAKPKRQVLACQKILGAAGALLKPSSTSYDVYTVYFPANTTSSVVQSSYHAYSLDTGKVVIGSKFQSIKKHSSADQEWLQDLLLRDPKLVKTHPNYYSDLAIYALGFIALVVIALTW
jgi:hypothetical protein